MKLGFGLYRHMLNDEHYAFAKQCGATHIVVHMVDYFNSNERFSRSDQPIGDNDGWGTAIGDVWTVDELVKIRDQMQKFGLTFYAIENFDPCHWDDILFDGPKKLEQLEVVKNIIRNVGKAGIPVFGYNFSLAGVAGRVIENKARGGAQTVGLSGINEDILEPMPDNMAWNMKINNHSDGYRPETTTEQLWERLTWFLNHIIPVAEEAGVRLAAHPDDPPLEFVRGQPRLVNQPHLYQKLLDIKPSKSNALEFCLGTIAEMSEGNVYEAVQHYASQDAMAYVHFRNVKGKVPHYHETFIDEGDIDMLKVLTILKENNYTGVLIPDHTPQMSCGAPWHAGMAYAMGYMQALLKVLK
ncbi:mannonate dehydratase [Providencia huaxiensis]|uniref:Mannonate dehydratase n=1 Tax=Providencia huaxiensis TaxID=2027290 RepID=A0A8I2AG08_9GAMM|nr:MULTISPECIES: mannonate dehydratase [Providencia]MBQ0268465.1 mannonate dehydratase [Providencia huaxiensis]MBQ0533220.1 mannonate dehydratase [Providencia huaxiensis]MBQ0588422.1 mannonate dehydratase [Providencia huaxiensis]MCD2528334.1 mannonate dehydratase [Providencia huaxiensis]MDI7238644.1 mannonate dehydratase [Providencia huaxiensis]